MFSKETRRYHTDAVVHVAVFIELAHSGVYQRITSTALAPTFKIFLIVAPRDIVVLGFPLVDAGMRELNKNGYMHNRVRMVAASFLTKHLLIDWRWGEAYFGQKLLDYELANNNGGWQWSAGSGVDAQPYFRVFNPYSQTKKFDNAEEYIRKWVPEYGTDEYPAQPIVAHKEGRDRALAVYKKALNEAREMA